MFGSWGKPAKDPNNYETLDCGPAPSSEQHPCPGFAQYEKRIEPVIDKWIKLLKKFFDNHRNYGEFSKVRQETRWGPEWTVVFKYKAYNNRCKAYAEFVLENLPAKWETDKESVFFSPSKDSPKKKDGPKDETDEIELEYDDLIFGDHGGWPTFPGGSGYLPNFGP